MSEVKAAQQQNTGLETFAVADPPGEAGAVLGTATAFALGSLMISSAQAQSRALESGVNAQTNATQVALANSTQCVIRILDMPTSQQAMINALIAASKVDTD